MSHRFAAALTTESMDGTSVGIGVARIRPMAAIALGFASAVVWGTADFIGGLKSRQLALLTVMVVSQFAALAALLVAIAIHGEAFPGTGILPWAALAALAGTIGLAAFYRALAVGVMGVVAPISACAAAIPVVVGVAAGERPSALQLGGIVVAIAGVALASWTPGEEPALGERPRGLGASTGVGLALVAALGFGFFFVGIDEASDRDLVWALLLTRTISATGLGLAALVARPSFAMTAADARAVAAVGLLDVSANALFAAASTLGLVSVVAVVSSMYPVTTILLARFLLGERLHRVQRGGAATALVGVALISAG
jgi:drug/metabolite transporter (DMT)-like permease